MIHYNFVYVAVCLNFDQDSEVSNKNIIAFPK